VNDIGVVVLVSDYDYKADLRGVVAVVGERGVCEYHDPKGALVESYVS